jgi:tetratricopeptide (TPR) repeat protein
MGIIYGDIGDTSKALECYESALEIRKRKGKEFEVAQSLHNIGSLWAMRQDYKKALKHWQNALQIYRRTLNDDHHMVACTLGNIKMAENMLEENSQF